MHVVRSTVVQLYHVFQAKRDRACSEVKRVNHVNRSAAAGKSIVSEDINPRSSIILKIGKEAIMDTIGEQHF